MSTSKLLPFSRRVLSTSTKVYQSYEDAVVTLNSLQSNAATLQKCREQRDRNRHRNIPDTLKFCERVDITPEDLDTLSVIHVSGTKGKGSTCAFCESILRKHGYKTGFFSSPHLVEVRERIRINGAPLSKEHFSEHFWNVYNKLESSKEAHDGAMPAYFRFLTILALEVFLREQVDVAILEVGIGGQYDCTNIVRKPVVCGISSLGYDHQSILGDTIDKIAWQKAGIMKPNVPAFTVSEQPENSSLVLQQRSLEIGSSLHLVPGLEQYHWPQGEEPGLGIAGDMQRVNAALALQLSHTWLHQHSTRKMDVPLPEKLNDEFCDIPIAATFPITNQYIEGLESCRWHGRNQIVRSSDVTVFLDGAHTAESVQQCVDWFREASLQEQQQFGSNDVVRILLFNATGDRQARTLLAPLIDCKFDAAVFCPNIAYNAANTADQTNMNVTLTAQLQKCLTNRDSWLQLLAEATPAAVTVGGGSHGDGAPAGQCVVQVCNSIVESLRWIGGETEAAECGPAHARPEVLRRGACAHVLCVGSLHLVGGVLGVLEPDLNK